MSDEYQIVLSFINQSSDFAYGFACGQIWEAFKRGDFGQAMIMEENFTQVAEMALQFGKRVRVVEGYPGWFEVGFDPILQVVQ